jgi:hypothetical protein
MIYETIIAGVIVAVISGIILDHKKRQDFLASMITFNKWAARKIEKIISVVNAFFSRVSRMRRR